MGKQVTILTSSIAYLFVHLTPPQGNWVDDDGRILVEITCDQPFFHYINSYVINSIVYKLIYIVYCLIVM